MLHMAHNLDLYLLLSAFIPVLNTNPSPQVYG